MKKTLLLFLFVSLCYCSIQAQSDSITKRLDDYLTSAHAQNHFNGNTLVAAHGKILLQKSYGLSNFAKDIQHDEHTVFSIASVTKQFTAAVILQLQEAGKLSVNDTLSKYFPDIPSAKKITLKHLLTHTSGLYDYVADIDEEDSAIACNPVNKQLVPDIISAHKPYFKPGADYRYCNSGYYLLGLIIEKVTGKSYEQNVRDIIFTPLQMGHSFFDFRHMPGTQIATGYKEISKDQQTEAVAWRWDSTVTYAAGGIYSTTADLYKWTQAIAQRKILSAASWQAMLTPYANTYGYGINVDSVFGKVFYAHGGGIPGFISYVSYFPADDVSIILLCNQGWFNDALNTVNTELAGIVFNKNTASNISLPIDSLKKFTGTYEFDKKHHVYITLDNGQLQMEAPEGGLPKSPLFIQDEYNFNLKIINARIEFTKDADGNIISLTAHYGGKHEVCRKTK